MYRVVRVNTTDHTTRAGALKDMEWIIERGYYWKKSERVHMPVGTLVVAMGCHGGAGLFLIGVVTGKWEDSPDSGSYKHRIAVQWQPVIYSFFTNRNTGKKAVRHVSDMLGKFNIRFGAEATQDEFRNVLAYVLTGNALRPVQKAKAA